MSIRDDLRNCLIKLPFYTTFHIEFFIKTFNYYPTFYIEFFTLFQETFIKIQLTQIVLLIIIILPIRLLSFC
jgi:hypothetical protein